MRVCFQVEIVTHRERQPKDLWCCMHLQSNLASSQDGWDKGDGDQSDQVWASCLLFSFYSWWLHEALNSFVIPPIPLQNHTGYPLYERIFLIEIEFLFKATKSKDYNFVEGTLVRAKPSIQDVGLWFCSSFWLNWELEGRDISVNDSVMPSIATES